MFPCNSSSTSSIGKNSDTDIEEEVQSSNENPLDSMQAWKDALPIRKGISEFYDGKSKSFASLEDAASTMELAKPENPYRRSHLQAYYRTNSIIRSSSGGIAKRAANSTRNHKSLALAVATNSSTSNSNSDNLGSEHETVSRSPPPPRCCLHPWPREVEADCSTTQPQESRTIPL